jgi:predicted XRE-type DNA-binding protein
MSSAEVATIQNLRSDLALQIGRHVRREGSSQLAAAKRLRIPQPTLSKIMNGRVDELSLELLIRIAVRAGLPVLLQTGNEPAEAGAFVSGTALPERVHRSKVGSDAREALAQSAWQLTPEQRLEAHLRHSELVTALHDAGQAQRAAAGKRRR